MKMSRMLIGLLCGSVFRLWAAGFELPESVFLAVDVEKAKAAAAASGNPVALMYSDDHTRDARLAEASVAMLDSLIPDTVVVFVDSRKKDFRYLPDSAQAAFRSEEAGVDMPKLVITDGSVSNVLAVVATSERLTAQRVDIKNALSRLGSGPGRVSAGGGGAQPVNLIKIPIQSGRPVRTWTSVSGHSSDGSLIKAASGMVTIRRADTGAVIQIPMQQLSAADQTHLRQQAIRP